MNCLLDTHVLLWTQLDVGQLGKKTSQLLKNSDTKLFLSPFSVLEISQLVCNERLSLDGGVSGWVDGALKALRCDEVDLPREVAIDAYQLPGTFHRDPADRVLVATARQFEMVMVTADRRILRYRGVKTFDARK